MEQNKVSSVTEKNKTNKRFVAGIFLLVSAFTIIVGTAFAFFSDYITGDISVTAGTLNITGTTQYYVNEDAAAVTSVSNFNPGDMVVAETAVNNAGNKSAWVRSRVNLGTIDAGIQPYIKVYAGKKTRAAILANPNTDLINYPTVDATAPVILNGTGWGAETETGGVSQYDSAVTIYFDTAALNAAQGKTVAVQTLVEAIQYRNNTSPVWTTLEQIN